MCMPTHRQTEAVSRKLNLNVCPALIRKYIYVLNFNKGSHKGRERIFTLFHAFLLNCTVLILLRNKTVKQFLYN